MGINFCYRNITIFACPMGRGGDGDTGMADEGGATVDLAATTGSSGGGLRKGARGPLTLEQLSTPRHQRSPTRYGPGRQGGVGRKATPGTKRPARTASARSAGGLGGCVSKISP